MRRKSSIFRQDTMYGSPESRFQAGRSGVSVEVIRREVRTHTIARVPTFDVGSDSDNLARHVGARNYVWRGAERDVLASVYLASVPPHSAG